jgi:ABC-type multidrug transport system fused ATPase/permease subunit
VWILDEAASHLDPQLDAQLHGLVERERRGGTVIVVAHRLSSVRDMHRIIVLYQGRIVETGTHTDLITKGGLYAHLVELQEAGAGKAV